VWSGDIWPICEIRSFALLVTRQIMTTAVRTVTADQPIASLVPLFSDNDMHYLPVVSTSRKLIGLVAQSDLIAALYASQLEQATYPEKKRA
jgi:CBS domain-containing membrane protein